MDNDNKKTKEDDNMATLVKPKQGIYEFEVQPKKLDEALARFDAPRLSKDFIEECIKVAKTLNKGKKV